MKHARRTDSRRVDVRLLAAVAIVAAGVTGACAKHAGAGEPGVAADQADRPMLADQSGGAVGEALAMAEPQYVNADSLKQQAIAASRSGDFDQSHTLLEQAIELRPDDPALRQMDEWVANFREQREEFTAERKEAYDRQVKDVELLRDEGYRAHALRAAHAASTLVEDPTEFAKIDWVQALIADGAAMAKEYEEQGDWLKAMRVYGDLAGLEGQNPEWAHKFKAAQRRVRLLATYVPGFYDDQREEAVAEVREVDALLLKSREDEAKAKGEEVVHVDDVDPITGEPRDPMGAAGDAADRPVDIDPETGEPTTRPAAEEEFDELAAEFKSDWHDALQGVSMTMLRDALEDARQYHVRTVALKEMLAGGIDAVLAVATTPGMEQAFPSLGDEAALGRFEGDLQLELDKLQGEEQVDRNTAGRLLRTITAVNNRTLKLPEEVLASEFADGALGKLDPFTSMIWPSQVNEFKKNTQGNFVGVGIKIRAEDSGDLTVISPLPGGPAIEDGIKYGDVITHIDGKSAHGISDSDAVNVITGEPGTKVTLTIRSLDGDSADHELVRRQIDVRSITGWRQLDGGTWDWIAEDETGIGYLKLTNFQASTGEELAEALEDLKEQGARGLILDLRYNPGGLLKSAVEVSDQFLTGAEGNGQIVSTRGERRGGPENTFRARRQASDVDLPMIVLVNGYSASASEIVSGALKDSGRAVVVGERTFGKGSVQMLFDLAGRGGDAWLKLTTSHYYLPSGKNIHKEELDTEWGVDPDVQVQMTLRQARDAIVARQALDVLRDDGTPATVKLRSEDGEETEVDAAKALLDNDAQLSAAMLLLRMQLAGDAVM